ncbi:MAG TPA: glycosyltransferase family 2 protein [Parvularculaceae bacterium]|nr:glycosyltransferase family 2 protein [Parvularculaceae bacterium]
MKLLVVITSYRAMDLTLACLQSLAGEAAANPGMKVGICDNGNEDDTAAFLNRAIVGNGWQDWAYVKTVFPNRGFSGGNNVILNDALNSGADYDYFLLLNADTIARPGTIKRLLETADSSPDIGIVGPRIESVDGGAQVSCFRYISPVSELIRSARTGPVTKLLKNWDVPIFPSERPVAPPWTSFCCALLRKEVVQQVGVLDEGYFLYFDDVDYCRSARNAGWGVLHQPEAVVVHYEGQSNPVVENTANRQRRPGYWYRSRSRYFRKFYGRTGLLAANLFWYGGWAISLSRELIGNKKPHLCEREWLDIWRGFLSAL